MRCVPENRKRAAKKRWNPEKHRNIHVPSLSLSPPVYTFYIIYIHIYDIYVYDTWYIYIYVYYIYMYMIWLYGVCVYIYDVLFMIYNYIYMCVWYYFCPTRSIMIERILFYAHETPETSLFPDEATHPSRCPCKQTMRFGQWWGAAPGSPDDFGWWWLM